MSNIFRNIYRFFSTMTRLYNAGDNNGQTPTSGSYTSVVGFLVALVIIIDSIVTLLLLRYCDRWHDVLLSFVLSSHAFLLGGMIVGFLFGIPRQVALSKNKDSKDSTQQDDTYYNDNTNLEDISDWLTKIIVGVSLVEFTRIVRYIDLAAKNLGESFICIESQPAYIMGYGTIVFYASCGLVCGYLWTRIKLVLILADTKEQQKKIKKLAFKNNISAITTAEESTEDYQWYYERIKALYDKRDIIVKDDLQKKRWGGKSANNGLRLTATVNTLGMGLFSVSISVVSEDSGDKGPVAFLIHNSFPKEIVITGMNGGKAVLPSLTAYEAFTVGALVYNNNEIVELELDLNEQGGYPKGFYYKTN